HGAVRSAVLEMDDTVGIHFETSGCGNRFAVTPERQGEVLAAIGFGCAVDGYRFWSAACRESCGCSGEREGVPSAEGLRPAYICRTLQHTAHAGPRVALLNFGLVAARCCLSSEALEASRVVLHAPRNPAIGAGLVAPGDRISKQQAVEVHRRIT